MSNIKKNIVVIICYLIVTTLLLTCEAHMNLYAKKLKSELINDDAEITETISVSEKSEFSEKEKITKTVNIISAEYEVPELEVDFKSWTNYEVSVKRNSRQWSILNSGNSWTDKNGFRRDGQDYLCAMGTYYVKDLGDRFKITTENNTFTIKICDIKDDKHTDKNNQYTTANSCIIEFYVTNLLCKTVKHSGNCSSLPELAGRIISIEKI